MAQTEDLNQLIRELNEDRPSAANGAEPAEAVRLDAWLEELVARAAHSEEFENYLRG